jgi:hypothetical protein
MQYCLCWRLSQRRHGVLCILIRDGHLVEGAPAGPFFLGRVVDPRKSSKSAPKLQGSLAEARSIQKWIWVAARKNGPSEVPKSMIHPPNS